MTAAPLAPVLCVDDEPAVLDGLRRSLRGLVTLHTATGGEEALAALDAAGPFAVVVSDMRMPGMDGVTLLARVRERAPDTVRMLLTGNADVEAAAAAVNRGQIFRFLCKPCPPDDLRAAVRAAVEHHRLVTAERELLDRTLRGSVQALVETLALANPTAFTRAARLRRLVRSLVAALGIEDWWHIEIAATLSQIGAVTLPPAVVEKLHTGDELTPEEAEMASRLPAIAEDVLATIPRLDAVRDAIRYQEKHFDGSGRPPGPVRGEQIPIGARILRVAIDYDQLEARGLSPALATDALRSRPGVYDPAVLDALEHAVGRAGLARESCEVTVAELRPGMILATDVRARNGVMLVGRGHEVTPSLLQRIRNFAATVGVTDRILVLIPHE
jgi:response regulator RpfG family c-di-GMP phosphodiesterase